MPPPLPFKDPKPKPASPALMATKKDLETRLNREKPEEGEEESTKTPDESSSGNPALYGLCAVLFPLALIAILFLPLAPIESNVESIPLHNWIMERSCDDITDHCWKGDGISNEKQYRSGLFWTFLIGTIMCVLGALFFLSDNKGLNMLGGFIILGGVVMGPLSWLWGTLALGFFEILAGNPYWIADLAVLIGSFIVINSPQDDGRQCNAKTISNRQCTNNKSQGSDYCGVHRCKMILPIGRCPNNKERGSNYCHQIDHR